MSGWSRTVKPSADKTIPANQIFGVDGDEISQTEGPSHVGWVRRRTVGSRVLYETLVAMKTPPVEDSGDNALFPGGITSTTTAAPTTSTTTAAPTTTTTTTP